MDITRGAAIALMIFVNHAGSQPAWLPHAAWDGLHLADVVMPTFLVVVGTSAALSLCSPRAAATPALELVKKVVVRVIKLWALGLIIQARHQAGMRARLNAACRQSARDHVWPYWRLCKQCPAKLKVLTQLLQFAPYEASCSAKANTPAGQHTANDGGPHHDPKSALPAVLLPMQAI